MGVKACGRNSCDHIMCDYLVCGAYLCARCYQELLDWRKTWTEDMRLCDVEERIEQFFESKPGATTKMLPPNHPDIEREFLRLVRQPPSDDSF